MKETKPFLLIVVSILLLVSLGLLSATIYMYINKPEESADILKNKKTTPPGLVKNNRDSLQKMYSAAIRDFDTSLTVPSGTTDTVQKNGQSLDSANNKTGGTAVAFEKLRNEINSILQDKSPDADLELAKMKIGELQALVGILKNKNTAITRENERLYALLKQLDIDERASGDPVSKNADVENTNTRKTQPDDGFRIENIQLSAITTSDLTEKETVNAVETDKLVGSFNIKNAGHNAVSEVMVVVLQPDGKVLQNSNWETGVFYTKAGKQIYSNKLRFDNTGETKKLNFSLEAEKYLPGKYTVEVYHNGLIIGRATKTLS